MISHNQVVALSDSFRVHYMINLVHVITDKPKRLHVHDTRSPSPFAQTNALFALIASGLRHLAFSIQPGGISYPHAHHKAENLDIVL